jgi:citrate synthase
VTANRQAGRLIDATEAARRLGVKPATLYAYVSRGVLRRRRSPGAGGGRRSLFDADEVDQLARRGRPRRPANLSELVIESELTAFVHGRPFYRGSDVVELAATWSFERVAEWLWTGDDGTAGTAGTAADVPRERREGRTGAGGASAAGWRCRPDGLAAAVRAQAALPGSALPLERLQVIVAALAATDPLRLQLEPAAVTAAGRNLIAGMVDALPPADPGHEGRGGAREIHSPAPPLRAPDAGAEDSVWGRSPLGRAGDVRGAGSEDGRDAGSGVSAESGPGAPGDEPIATRLWRTLTANPPEPGLMRALRAALVLLADHELAASTLAVRIAASVRADPYAVVATGLGALGGTLHGGASLGAEAMLDEVAQVGAAAPVIAERLRRGERIPGQGHRVYRSDDPRATALFEWLRAAAHGGQDGAASAPRHPPPDRERLRLAEEVMAETRRRGLPEPNIDFALATLTGMAGMIRGAGETIFAVARSAGWIAHALEEYRRGTPLRPRAVYTGLPPRGDT